MIESKLQTENPSWWNKRSRAEKALFLIVAVLIFLLIIILCVQIGFGPGCKESVCLTPACVKIASSILDRIDLSMNPCEDFYSFACGNFIKNTAIPEDKVEISSGTIVGDIVEEKIGRLLDKPVDDKDIKAFVLAKYLYLSCMDTEDVEINSLNEIKRLIKEAGGWPVIEKDQWNETEFDWISTSYKFMKIGFEDYMFLNFEILPDPSNSSINVLWLNQLTSPLDRIRRDGFNNTIMKEFHKYMVRIAITFGADNDTVSEEIRDIVDFVIAIAQITVLEEDRRDHDLQNNPMTIRQLEKEFSYVPWLTYINTKLYPYYKMTYNDTIIVKIPSYYKKLENLLENTPKRTLANYMFWYTIEKNMLYLNAELGSLGREVTKVLSGASKQQPRREGCLKITTTLVVACGALYVRNYFEQEGKQIRTEIIKPIQEQFIQNLEKIDWMDQETKKHAIEKAKAMYLHLAYPDELLDDEKLNTYYEKLTFSTTNYLGNMLNLSLFKGVIDYPTLNKHKGNKIWHRHAYAAITGAYYHVGENSIEFLAAILQNVYYDISRPKYMNYGAIGSAVGHEITHGFDDIGRLYDKNGNLLDWWAPKTKQKFYEKKQCMIDQYGNITVPEANLTINGIATQGENIADNAGIRFAYLAYKKWSKNNGRELTLPGLAYTPEQMFWISYGNMWCETKKPEYIKLELQYAHYAPTRYRINIPLMNLDYFAKDFGCEKETKMNPKQKCHVW